MHYKISHVLIAAISFVASVKSVASQSASNANVPISVLSSPDAKSSTQFGVIVGVRGLLTGNVIVNDGGNHQLVMLNSKLDGRKIILDSAKSIGNQSYGARAVSLIPYPGDSLLFVDPASASLLLIAPTGAIARVMAAPVPAHVGYLVSGSGTDAHGNLIYGVDENRPPYVDSRNSVLLRRALTGPDSTLVVRASFQTGRIDTAGHVKFPRSSRVVITFEGSRIIATSLQDPMPTQDDFAVLSDGTIAFVRGHDYRVDFILPDGRNVAGPKMPFDWRRLTDIDKQYLIDSVAKASDAIMATIQAAGKVAPSRTGVSVKSDGGGSDVRTSSIQPGTAEGGLTRRFGWLPLDEIVDYYPPIRRGALKPDMDGNLWILPTTSAQSQHGELVYDVVNNRGQLTRRVRVPEGRSIAGFGKNGVVYLMWREGNGWWLEKTHIVSQ